MTKKSAASAKLKKSEPEISIADKQQQLKQCFDDQKWYIQQLAETQVKIAARIDNMLNLRELAISFGIKEPEISLIKDLQNQSVAIYKKILKVVASFEYEKFLEDTCYDYFEKLVPDCKKIEDNLDLLYAAIDWLSIKPFADQMLSMHQTILGTKKKLGL